MKTFNNFQAIQAFAYWQYNYSHNFIKVLWPGNIGDHLQRKFDNLYAKHGARGVALAFYDELDLENRKKLTNYVVALYAKSHE